jgi:hypothetical protein
MYAVFNFVWLTIVSNFPFDFFDPVVVQ